MLMIDELNMSPSISPQRTILHKKGDNAITMWRKSEESAGQRLHEISCHFTHTRTESHRARGDHEGQTLTNTQPKESKVSETFSKLFI